MVSALQSLRRLRFIEGICAVDNRLPHTQESRPHDLGVRCGGGKRVALNPGDQQGRGVVSVTVPLPHDPAQDEGEAH